MSSTSIILEERIERIRSWRDGTRARFERLEPSADPVTENARAWWHDVDALLGRIDELEAGDVLDELAAGMRRDSEAWFPAIHAPGARTLECRTGGPGSPITGTVTRPSTSDSITPR